MAEDEKNLYVLYHIVVTFSLRIFFCNCMTPYNNASAVGGHPGSVLGTGDYHIDIYWYDAVAAPDYSVRVVVVSTSVCAGAHADHVAGLWHLVIDFSQGRSHLVCQGSSYNHYIALSGTGAKHDSFQSN